MRSQRSRCETFPKGLRRQSISISAWTFSGHFSRRLRDQPPHPSTQTSPPRAPPPSPHGTQQEQPSWCLVGGQHHGLRAPSPLSIPTSGHQTFLSLGKKSRPTSLEVVAAHSASTPQPCRVPNRQDRQTDRHTHTHTHTQSYLRAEHNMVWLQHAYQWLPWGRNNRNRGTG